MRIQDRLYINGEWVSSRASGVLGVIAELGPALTPPVARGILGATEKLPSSGYIPPRVSSASEGHPRGDKAWREG